MRLHVLGLPHALPIQELSHCAYTGKVRRFAPMMAPLGFECIYYGVGEPDSLGWADVVPVLTEERQRDLLGYDPREPSPKFVGRSSDVRSPLYREFNAQLATRLSLAVRWGDIVCATFGHGHEAALHGGNVLKYTVETGVGYPVCITGYRIYESYAWWHWHLGRENRYAYLSEWVVPNYFDMNDWPQRPEPPASGQYVLYFGRITQEKGMNVVWNLARERPDLRFVMCGQGDPTPWMTEPNIEYRPPVSGSDRTDLFHNARVVLLPTDYLEPFGGVAVEAMLTDTPVLTSHHGAFTETVPEQWRCRTMNEWLTGLDATLRLPRGQLRDHAYRRYALDPVGRQYADILTKIPAMRERGWYT